MGKHVSKAIPLGQPSAASHDKVMDRLRKTYVECGGTVDNAEKEFFEGVPRFEGLKFLLSKKIGFTRKALARLEEGKSGEVGIRRKQRIRAYFVSLDSELRKLEEEYEKTRKPPLRWLKIHAPPDPRLVESRKADLEICRKHVEEVKLIFKARYRDDITNGGLYQSKNKKKVDKLLGGGSSDEDDEYVDDEDIMIQQEEQNEWMEHIALPDDPEASNLPAIDCTVVLQKVKQNRKQMHKKLEVFGDKLDEMKEHAKLMTDQIEESGEIAAELREKIENETENLKKVNKKVDKATEGVNTQTKLLLCIVVMVCICFAVIILYVVLLAVGVVPGGINVSNIYK